VFKFQLGFFLCFLYGIAFGQEEVLSVFEAVPEKGKQSIDQVLQTQLTLPKILLVKGFDARFTVFFELDSSGAAINHKFEDVKNNILRQESIRMLRFVKFKHIVGSGLVASSYYLNFHISTDKYNSFLKQRLKPVQKKNSIADSSFIIYSRADRSPEYFKNGDEGLSEYILSEIEYPAVAKERSIEGTVLIEFVVETNGFVSNLKVLKGVNGGCTEEAIRLLEKTKWQPALINNKLVRYKTTYPITFNLRSLKGTQVPSVIGQ
jgi:TonB family protein